MILDVTQFFTAIREQYGRLDQTQVDSLNAILDRAKSLPRNQIAYILATAKHEARWRPEREGFAPTDAQARAIVRARKYGKPDPQTGHVYYGRGFVQLTWRENYQRAGVALDGLRLVENPDLALEPRHAAEILVRGMSDGWFTRKKLDDYLTERSADFVNARRVVNGLDKAQLIARYARTLEQILREAGA